MGNRVLEENNLLMSPPGEGASVLWRVFADQTTDCMQLGLNYGGGNGSTKEICVRLRPASDRHSFLPLGSLLQTMLHELTHNHISPHDATFYAMLAEMEKVAFLSTHLPPPPPPPHSSFPALIQGTPHIVHCVWEVILFMPSRSLLAGPTFSCLRLASHDLSWMQM